MDDKKKTPLLGVFLFCLFVAMIICMKNQYRWGILVVLVVIAVVLGVFTGIIFSFDYRLSLLAGYAGTDILEGIYKSFAVSKVYVGKGKK